ncbi:hypothetical protein BJ742DRAFT_802237 [Cladochytrium replicatum]|nr:hypothetical protein BJ742DRAFT_802237 [Cladochytrium replicatum]
MAPIRKRNLIPKPIFDEELLLAAFSENNINPKNATKVWRYLIQKNCRNLAEIPDLPKAALQLLQSDFAILTSKVVRRTDAADNSTTKLLIELQDGRRIESVIMRYGDVELDNFPEEEKAKRIKISEDGSLVFKSKKRATLCVSSQVGCAMACTFCATGTMGLQANLTAGEIIEQLVHANAVERIRNVVFMGMGEPLDAYGSVMGAIRCMTDTSRFGLSPARISLSTVGVVPRLYALLNDAPDVGLALSLHAPTQDLRMQIVPTAKAWHIDRIMAATDAFISQQNASLDAEESAAIARKDPNLPILLQRLSNKRRRVLVEFVIIANVNDSEDTAHALGRLLSGTNNASVPLETDVPELPEKELVRQRARRKENYLLNVIPYNPTAVPHDYRRPSRETLSKFVAIVRDLYGVHTMLRQTMGSDVDSACGQLVISDAKERGEDVVGLGEIEEIVAQVAGMVESDNVVVLGAGAGCDSGVSGGETSRGLGDLEDLVGGSSRGEAPARAKVTQRKAQKAVKAELANNASSPVEQDSGAPLPASSFTRDLLFAVVFAVSATALVQLMLKWFWTSLFNQ